MNAKVPRCVACEKGVVKPDIVFFGENLHSRFFSSSLVDFPNCGLLIVMGTSLVVRPFASLVNQVPSDTPRLLINLEPARTDLLRYAMFFGKESATRESKDWQNARLGAGV
ncbi:hypothetical protein niasHT_028247 [Heterodera trifolii]|uniref:Deacetylase sirtuin-type domain-containing protein n=1 Tax=Heterodera trifolii TaxID=157864 RepID=A0ABD2JU89_9BILA